MKKIILLPILILLLASPIVNAGLVPCGNEYKNIVSKEGKIIGQEVTNPCTFCHLAVLFSKLLDFALMIIFPIAAVMFVYGGFLIMTSRESPEGVKKGRDVIQAAAIGILIALLSWLILDTIFKILAQGWGSITELAPWDQIRCK